MKWPKRILEEYEAFDNRQYNLFAGDLVELFFDTSMPPCFFAGDLTKAKYGLLGLNPGLGEGRERELEEYKKLRKTNEFAWKELYYNFFSKMKEKNIYSNYYRQFAVLLSGVLGFSQIPKPKDRYDLLQVNLVNFDLIPYHSKNFKLGLIEDDKFHIIKPYIDITKNLIQKSSVEYLFINGKPWKLLVKSENNILDVIIERPIKFFNGKKTEVTAHFGKCMSKNFVWFDKFITSIRGLTNDNLHCIGREIRKYWEID